MLDPTPNQPTKFRTKNWVEINYDSRGTYNFNSQIKLVKVKLVKLVKLRSILCGYSDAEVLVSGTITVPNTGVAANPNNGKI